MDRKQQFIDDLVSSIMNESRPFGMAWFTIYLHGPEELATCDTAGCMAGHIEAIRPELAKKFWDQDGLKFGRDNVARQIWKEETGEECKLDFFGVRTSLPLKQITRKDAVEHIL